MPLNLATNLQIALGKSIKKQSTENSQTQHSPKKSHDEKMGILGPVLRGERGDVIQIYFKVVYKSVKIF